MRSSSFVGIAVALLAVALVAHPGVAGSKSHMPAAWCGPPLSTKNHEPVRLFGSLSKQTVWGPPNYGGTPDQDKRYIIWVLKLDFATPVIADADTGDAGRKIIVSAIQLLGPEASPNRYDEFLNRHVLVTGGLWTAYTPLARTPVTITPSAVEVTGDVRCDGRPAMRL